MSNTGEHAPETAAARRARRRRDQMTLAADEVRRHWDLGDWVDFHRTPKGSTNVSYFLTTSRGRFVVRVSNARKTEEGMAWEVRLLEHLRARGYPAPRAVPTRAGSAWARADGALCLVTERLPGTFPDRGRPAHLRASARALAWFHREARHLPDDARPTAASELPSMWEGPAILGRAEALVADLTGPAGRDRFRRAREALERSFTSVAGTLVGDDALPTMTTHGSLGYSAVLFEGDRLTAVLDYERAAHEVRALDLAYTLRALTRSRAEEGGFDVDRLGAVVAAYQEEEPLAPGEVERLPTVLRAQRLLKVMGKARNLLTKQLTVPQEEKDAVKLTEIAELELPRLRWLETHEGQLIDALRR